MDVIAMHQAGFTQAVASLGTSFTDGQAAVLKRYVKQVLLSYDSDGAGVKAAMRNIGILHAAGLTGKVVNLEPYKDPDEFMKNLGPEEFQKRLDQAENSFFYQIRQIEKNYRMEDPASRSEFYHEIAKRLCGFADEIERDSYVKAMSQKYFIDEGMLRREVASYGRVLTGREGQNDAGREDRFAGAYPQTAASPAARPKDPTADKRISALERAKIRNECLLLTCVSDDPGLYPQIRDYISAEDFSKGVPRQAAEKYFAILEKEAGDKLAQASGNGVRPHASPSVVIAMFEDEEEQRQAAALFETRLPGIGEEEVQKLLRDVLCSVKRNSIDRLSANMTDAAALGKLMKARRDLTALQKIPLVLMIPGSES